MAEKKTSRIPEILVRHEKDVLEDWLREQMAATTLRKGLMPEAELRRQSDEFLTFSSPGAAAGASRISPPPSGRRCAIFWPAPLGPA